MAYKALYRTYRPQKFSEVIGQEAIVRTLQNALATGKTTHAYLFSGPRGTGKTTVARIFAKALNCDRAPTTEPCGECTSCREIAESNNPDVIEIDAASNNGVDEIRDIREKVKFLPGGSKYKIYIIDEVHMLSQGAFNALLKTLEEPPKHVIFILATTEPYKVIPTILSRCQRYDFKSLSVKEIKEQLEKVAKTEQFSISDEALIAIAESAEGGMRDAFSYLDQAASFADNEITIDDVNSVTGNLNYDKTIELAQYLENGNINQALTTINDLLAAGKEISKIVNSILQFYRDLLLYKNIDISTTSKYIYEKPAFKELAENINEAKIFYYVDTLSDIQVKIKSSITPHIYLEVAIIKMINIQDCELDLIKRFKTLEEKIENIKANPEAASSQDQPVNDEKVNDIDYRLNRVVQELSKLELHKLIDRVNLLENKETTPKASNNDNELGTEVALLKQQVTSLKGQLDVISLELNQKWQIMDNKVDHLKTTPKEETIDTQAIFNIIQDEIKPIKQDVSKLYSQIETLKQLKQASPITSEGQLMSNNDDVLAKLSSLENKVYKLMTNALAQTTSKKGKSKASEGQIVLFGDEVTSLDTLEKPVKIQIDFAEFQKNDIEKEEIKEESTIIVEQTKEDEQEPLFEKEQDEPIVNRASFEELNKPTEKPAYQEKNEPKQEQVKQEEKLAIKELKITDFQEPETNSIQTTIIENQEIIDRPHSQLVRKLNPEKPEIERMSAKDLDEEKAKPDPIIKPIIHDTPKQRLTIAKFVEKILHETRNEIARNDKPRVLKLWATLDKSANSQQQITAELLQEGLICAVGEKTLLIVYPNATLCNQVMKPQFKKDALRLLYDSLGDTYDYLAIPDYLWKEKRNEYVSQYNIGTTFPILTEVEDPNLMFDDEETEKGEFEKKIDEAKSLFGDDFVKIE